MLTQLVAEPSVSSTSPDIDRSNLRVIEQLANWLDGLGFHTEIMGLPGRADKANLIATLGGTVNDGMGGLVLAGHTDTVPFDEALWDSDPFIIKDDQDRYYGLGSCDMKGFFPVALQAAATFSQRQLSAPLTIVATSDEESSMAGGRYLLECGKPKADYAIIGEPTAMQPVFAHKGISMMTIKIEGSSGHSSDPSLGANALDAMHAVMSDLIALRQELAANNQNDAFAVNIPTMNLGCMRAGDNPNRICGHAELQIDLRLLPGMDSQALHEELERRIHKAVQHRGVALTLNTAYPPIPPFQTDPNGALVQALSNLSGNQPGTVAFGTEAHFMQTLGMETVVWGPGSIDQAHQPNEYLSKGHLAPATNTLRAVIERFCLA
jgi:acetylornithine deacetylase